MAYPLQVISKLKFTLLLRNVRLHLSVRIVDDGQEHVEQDEEDEEYVRNEEYRSEDTVSVFDLVEVEVTKNDTE